jgi:hypothetical protein
MRESLADKLTAQFTKMSIFPFPTFSYPLSPINSSSLCFGLFLTLFVADKTVPYIKNGFVNTATQIMRKLLDDKVTAHNFLNLGLSLCNIASFAQSTFFKFFDFLLFL